MSPNEQQNPNVQPQGYYDAQGVWHSTFPQSSQPTYGQAGYTGYQNQTASPYPQNQAASPYAAYQQPYGGQQGVQTPYPGTAAGYQNSPNAACAPQQPDASRQGVQTGYQPSNQYPYQVEGRPVTGPSEMQRKVKPPRREIDMEPIVRPFVLFGLPVLMVLFVLCMIMGSTLWLKWVFVAMALSVIGVMWINHDFFQRDLMLTFSCVLGALTVVTLVSAIATAGTSGTQTPAAGSAAPAATLSVNSDGELLTVAPTEEMAWVEVTPTPATNATAAESGLNSAAVERMMSFLYFWHANEYTSMLSYCLPSWCSAQSSPEQALFHILSNRIPTEYKATAISGTDNDITRTVTTEITIKRAESETLTKYLFKIVMTNEDGIWYIDPRSLESNEKATATPASAEITQPPTPAPAADTNVILYYNPDGGTLYHISQNCRSTNEKYLPFKGSFTYGQLNESPYDELTPCNVCGAPLRPSASE